MLNNACIPLAIVLLLSGCAAKPMAPTQTVEVQIPFRVACTVATPSAPIWAVPFVARGADVYDQMKALLVDRALSFGYQKELETALSTCKR